MTGYQQWRDNGHLDRAIAIAGGLETFESEMHQLLADCRDSELVAGQHVEPKVATKLISQPASSS